MKVICHVFFKPAEDTPPIQTIVKTFSFLMFTATSSEVFDIVQKYNYINYTFKQKIFCLDSQRLEVESFRFFILSHDINSAAGK